MRRGPFLLLLLASASLGGCASSAAEPPCSLHGTPTSGSGHPVDDATWRAHPALRAAMAKQSGDATLSCAEARAILRAVDGPDAPPASLALTRGGQTWFVEFRPVGP